MLRDFVEAQDAQDMNILESHLLWQCRYANTHHCHGNMDGQLEEHTKKYIKEQKRNHNQSQLGQTHKTTCGPLLFE